jgi:riboflavin kinase/FMN adenylyltransferase
MAALPIRVRVLGSGTSVGVPFIGCDCEVCLSDDPRDNRLRPSIAVEYNGRCVLVDTAPDFRTQALRAKLARVDAILYTHHHADHVMGLDDVRPFNFRQGGEIPVYGSEETLSTLKQVFPYAFHDRPSEQSRPRLTAHAIYDQPIDLFGLRIQPLPLEHGKGLSLGFRFGNVAYLTDHSRIPETTRRWLQGLDVLFLDALRYRRHPTHSTIAYSVKTVQKLQPKRAYFTHISHDLKHARVERTLPPNVRLSCDGLTLHTGWQSQPAKKTSLAIYRSLAEAAGAFGPCALSIGNFDGPHAGHVELFRRVRQMANDLDVKAAVVTFEPHPLRVLAPEKAPALLSSLEVRMAVMEAEGIEQLLVLPFDAELARLEPQEFFQRVLVDTLQTEALAVGDNFRFGRNQSGDIRTLQQLAAAHDMHVEAMEPVSMRGHVISSSLIRRLLKAGKVQLAARLLRRPFALQGPVVSGHGIGRRETVPTLNLQAGGELIPTRGVYVTRTTCLQTMRQWHSVTNVGLRPTFGNSEELSIETFLLQPLKDEDPKDIRVEFLRFVREERRFATSAELKARILLDVARATAWFRRVQRWIGSFEKESRETVIHGA